MDAAANCWGTLRIQTAQWMQDPNHASIDSLMERLDQYQERLRQLQATLAERHKIDTQKAGAEAPAKFPTRPFGYSTS